MESKNNSLDKIRFLLYESQDGNIKTDVVISNDTVWLSQKAMAKLFGVETNTINYHLKEVFSSGELDEDRTIRNFRIVQSEGDRDISRDISHYNLDAIISVGYRVNSKQATQFRIWATKILKEYMIKGFVLDDKRLAQGEKVFGNDYFRELLERVRSIRASERRIWQQITDIFAECSIDYDVNSETTKDFYSMVQNKFHFAITGKTAPEIISNSADKDKPNMGLTTWRNSPDGRILKSDVVIAKNYLSEKEIKKLERAVTGYFDYIEDLIESENAFTMEEFAKSVDDFLSFRRYEILKDKGSVSKKQANKKAQEEYDEFNKVRDFISDFDKSINLS